MNTIKSWLSPFGFRLSPSGMLRARKPTTLLIASLAIASVSCIQSEAIDPMMTQPKYVAYARNDFFIDGRAMRTPPANTIPRERVIGDLALTTGSDDKGNRVTIIPLPLTHDQIGRASCRERVYGRV